ncbi:MAG: class II aldolase/adducin family protein [Myxococcales bacterium]|nr:class II aldolase/adducin family protein [Myxococcales bacterium]
MSGGARHGAIHQLHGRDVSFPVLKRALLDVAHSLHSSGWVANHDGNVSARLEAGRFLITPTALSKRVLDETDPIVVDRSGRVLQGGRRPFSEFKMHVAVYDMRPDAKAVVHAHPPCATALSVMGVEVEPKMMAEPVVSLGNRVPMVPYGFPNSAEQIAQIREMAANFDVVTLAHHGALAWGDDLEQALMRLELVEHLAKIQLAAMQVGPLRTLPDADVSRLLEKRAAAGLGPAGRRGG